MSFGHLLNFGVFARAQLHKIFPPTSSAKKDCTSWAYLSLSSQQQLRVNMDIQTIDAENDVLSVRPLKEAHFEEESNEQQRKRTKFNVSELELE